MIYIRLSVHRERDPSLSPEAQKSRCEQYAASQGWTIVDTIEDLDQSAFRHGDRLDRPGLKRAIKACQNGKADVILAARPDRFARDAQDGIELTRSRGVKIATPGSGVVGADAFSQFSSGLGFLPSELESAQLSERMIDSIETRRRAGRWTQRSPFGYETFTGPDGGKYLRPRKDTQKMVVKAAKKVAAGATVGSVVADWNRQGLPGARGGRWTYSTLVEIFRNPLTLHGWTRYRGELLRGEDGEPLQIAEPLLPPDLAAAIQKQPWFDNGPRRQRSPGRLHAYPLGSFLRCAACGSRLHITTARGSDFYRCGAPEGACNFPVMRKRLDVEAAFDEWIAGQPKSATVTQYKRVDTTEDAAAQRAKADAKVNDILSRMAAPGADVMGLAGELTEAKAAAEAIASGTVVDEVVEKKIPVAKLWPKLDDDDRRDFLATWLDHVSVFKRGAPEIIRIWTIADVREAFLDVDPDELN